MAAPVQTACKMGKHDALWGAAFQNEPSTLPPATTTPGSPAAALRPITPSKPSHLDMPTTVQTFDSALQQVACAAGAVRGSTAMRSSVPGVGFFGPSEATPEGWLQKTPSGYWVGSVFIPRAWLTDKFHEGRLDPAMLWTFYFSRILTAVIPILITFIALIVSVSKKGCECAHPSSATCTVTSLHDFHTRTMRGVLCLSCAFAPTRCTARCTARADGAMRPHNRISGYRRALTTSGARCSASLSSSSQSPPTPFSCSRCSSACARPSCLSGTAR